MIRFDVENRDSLVFSFINTGANLIHGCTQGQQAPTRLRLVWRRCVGLLCEQSTSSRHIVAFSSFEEKEEEKNEQKRGNYYDADTFLTSSDNYLDE